MTFPFGWIETKHPIYLRKFSWNNKHKRKACAGSCSWKEFCRCPSRHFRCWGSIAKQRLLPLEFNKSYEFNLTTLLQGAVVALKFSLSRKNITIGDTTSNFFPSTQFSQHGKKGKQKKGVELKIFFCYLHNNTRQSQMKTFSSFLMWFSLPPHAHKQQANKQAPPPTPTTIIIRTYGSHSSP